MALLDKLLRKSPARRIGVIINKVQRREGKGQYADIYIIRTGYDDIINAKMGEFTKLKRRHLEGVVR